MIFPPLYSKLREEILGQLDTYWSPYVTDLDQLLHLKWLGYQPQSIYDIGASNSVWSTMANLVFPNSELQMFEPLFEVAESYRNSAEVNSVIRRFRDNARHRIHPVALGSKSGTCSFQWLEENIAGSTSLELGFAMKGATVIDVPMHRLDDYAALEKLPPPDLVKLDTQGAEMGILEGMEKSLQTASVIFIECWLARGYGPNTPLFLEIANHLSSAGFDLFIIGDEYRGPDGIVQSKDAVFVRRDLPLNPHPPLDHPTEA